MFTQIPSRIRRMPKRRQKIALKKLVHADLMHLVGEPINALMRVEVVRIMRNRLGIYDAEVIVTPIKPVESISIPLDPPIDGTAWYDDRDITEIPKQGTTIDFDFQKG